MTCIRLDEPHVLAVDNAVDNAVVRPGEWHGVPPSIVIARCHATSRHGDGGQEKDESHPRAARQDARQHVGGLIGRSPCR